MVDSDRPIAVLVNRSAGSAAGAVDAIGKALAQEGVDAEIRELEPAEVSAALAREIASGAAVVGVAGGDGTLSGAAGALAGTATVLAPFPLGTLNHFARRLGLEDVEAAARALRSRRIASVAIGRAGERPFINNASCGFYPHVVRHRERLRPWVGKWPAAALATARVFLGHRRMRLHLDTPENTLERKVAGLWVGIGRGSFRLPGEDRLEPDAGVLEIVLPHASSRLRLLGLATRVLWRLFRRRRPRTRGLEILHAPAFTLESHRQVDVALDGEPFRMTSPLQFRLERDALRVIVGVTDDDGKQVEP